MNRPLNIKHIIKIITLFLLPLLSYGCSSVLTTVAEQIYVTAVDAEGNESQPSVSLQVKTLRLLKSLKKRHDLTIFLISHDLRKVARFCDRVAVMYLGRLVEVLPGKQLLTNCRHPYTEALITSIPIADPSQRKRKKVVITGEVPNPVNLPPGCTFHPRCPKRFDKCDKSVPLLITPENADHPVACFLYE